MDTLDREESGLKLVHGLAPLRPDAVAFWQTRIAGERRRSPNLYRIAYSCRTPLHQPHPVTRG
eukprot:5697504-Prymnesium_polylepis.1